MKEAKMNVSLLECTPNAERLIFAAFRQCYSAESMCDVYYPSITDELPDSIIEKFIQEKLAMGHESPIEHVSFTFAVEGVSRALTHQLVRHRIASYSHQSQRYVSAEGFEVIIPPAIKNNVKALPLYLKTMKTISTAYTELKEILSKQGNGSKANEDARFVLPNGVNTMIVFTMNCRSLFNFFRLRCCARAQWEIRSLAFKMLSLCKREAPIIFEKAGPPCEQTKTCPEHPKYSCGKYPTRVFEEIR